MKYLKKFKAYLEDATVSAATGGVGAVISPQPGSLPGTTGTTGSGDVSFYLKKERRKKGGPNQVSDLRDLKEVETKRIVDIKESYKDVQEYINDITDGFKKYNIRPVVLNHILDFYKDEIVNNYENDKQPKEFVDKIVKEMEIDLDGGFMQQTYGSKGCSNKVIKYM